MNHTFNHIFHGDRTPAVFDPQLPFWFCDVDGVLSPIPYIKEWNDVAGQTDLEATIQMANNLGFTYKRVEPDPETHYPVDTELLIPFNKAGDFEGYPADIRNVNVRFNTDFIKRVKNIIMSGKVNFVYLTTWNHQAITLLNPIFGLPDSIPYLQWEGNYTDYGSQYGKRNAIMDFYETLKKNHSTLPPFVWVDDQVTANHETCGADGKPGRWNSLMREHTGGVESLIIKTDTRWGVSRSDMTAIEDFIESH